jgi:hypothetical protein
MTEEEEDSGNAQRSWNTGERPDQEIDRGGAVERLQGMTNYAVVKNLQQIIDVVVENIQVHKHLTSVKLLFDIVARLQAGKVVPEVVYQSLAETLWEAHNQQALLAAGEVDAAAGIEQAGA